MQNSSLPKWFWKLLPFLTGRQSAADFEQWLNTDCAKNHFPDEIYTKLWWVNYRGNQVKNDILQIISNQYGRDEKMLVIREMLDLLANKLDYLKIDSPVWEILPFSTEYQENLYSMILVRSEIEMFIDNENMQKIYHQKSAEFFAKLCDALVNDKGLPELPIMGN